MAISRVLVISSLGNEALDAELDNYGIEGILKKPLSPEKVSEFLGGGTMSVPEAVEKAIVGAVEQTFINMAFIDVIPTASKDIPSDVSQLIVIDITRPERGTILLHLPLALKRQVAETIHAENWEDMNARQIDDCLLEVLNVLAGNFLNNLRGEKVKYNITFPQIVFDEDEFQDSPGFDDFYFDAEGIHFRVSVRMEA